LNKDTGQAELKNVKGVFFNNNRPGFYFISPFAKWEMQKKEIYLEDPIGYDLKKSNYLNRVDPAFKNKTITEEASVIERQKEGPGYWFKADYLAWKLATQKVTCKSGIVLNGTDFNVRSKNLEGDLGFSEFLLTGKPSAVVSPSTQKESQTTIDALEFWFINAKESIVASQEVKIVYTDPKIGPSKANLNTELAIFSQREGEIYCQNGVTVLYGNISARSDRAALSPKKEVIVLKGNASAVQKENRLKGEELTMWLKEKKVSVKGKTRIILTD
jgi:lipopolysaccharide export system protein LptA